MFVAASAHKQDKISFRFQHHYYIAIAAQPCLASSRLVSDALSQCVETKAESEAHVTAATSLLVNPENPPYHHMRCPTRLLRVASFINSVQNRTRIYNFFM